LYGSALAPSMTFAGQDFVHLFFPRAFLEQEIWKNARIPLWDPYSWGGNPLLAAMQGSVFYPPMWLALLLPLPWSLQLFLFLHYLWAGLGAVVLSRRLFMIDGPSACVAGIAYAGCGYYLGRLEQVPIVAASSWLPWVLWAALRLLQTPAQRPWLLAAVLALAALAGHPQTVLFGLLAGTVVAICYVFSRLLSGGLGIGGKSISCAGLACMAACGLSALQLLPTQELGGLSERVWPWPRPTEPELRWQDLQGWILPSYFRHMIPTEGRPIGYSELALYCGTVTNLLFLLGVFLTLLGKLGIAGCALTVGILFSVLFALGTNGGISPWFFEWFPLLKGSRGAVRMLNAALLFQSCIAAAGLDWLARLASARLARKRVLLVVPLTAFVAVVADYAITQRQEFRSLLVNKNRVLARSPFLHFAHTPSRLYRFIRNDSDYYLNNSAASVSERAIRLQPNLQELHHVHLLDGYEEGLLPTRQQANFLRAYLRNFRTDQVDAPLLSLMGCNLMFTDYPPPAPGSAWSLVHELPSESGLDGKLRLWKSSYPAVQAFSESGYAATTPTPPFAEFINAYTVPRDIDDTAGFRKNGYWFVPPQQTKRPHPAQAWDAVTLQSLVEKSGLRLISNTPGQITFQTDRELSGTIVLCQTAHPGWKLHINGDHAAHESLLPVSAFMSTVQIKTPLPAGSTLSMRFEPFSFHLGMFVTLVSLGSFLAGAIYLTLLRIPKIKHALTRTTALQRTPQDI